MRNKQAFKNMLANVLLQICAAVSGIILPRFIIEAYGSAMNGMISSITQFLSYIGLVEAGVGSASAVALYVTIANNDVLQTNGILSATRKFYLKSGYIYLFLTIIFACVYPNIINAQIEKKMVVMMVLILSGSTVIDFFVLGKYRVLLTADQKNYVVAAAQITGTILTLILSIWLIRLKMNVLIVKAVAAFVFILRVFLVYIYVKIHYKDIDFGAQPAYDRLDQRWDALLHQVVGTIVLNTGIVMLTVFYGEDSLLEVSVYTTYNMVGQALYLFLNSFSTALSAGFGQVAASGDKDVLDRAYSGYEYLYVIVLHVMYTCMAVLILPFIHVYTINVKDVNYVRMGVAMLFVLSGYIQNMRIPSLTMICSVGHFRETRFRAVAEAVINIVVSMLLVFPFGIAGVLAGTICSFAYRSIDCILYNSKYIVKDTQKRFFKRMAVNLIVSLVIIVIGLRIVNIYTNSFTEWFIMALVCGIMCTGIICFINYVMEPEEFKNLISRFKGIFTK